MGSVKHTMIQKLQIRTAEDAYHDETIEFYIMTLGEHDIILGMDWLQAHNPKINWAEPRLAFTRCPNTCTLSMKPVVISSQVPQTRDTTINILELGPEQPCNTNSIEPLKQAFADTAMEPFLWSHSFSKYDHLAIQAKTTASTQFVAKTALKPSVEHIPSHFWRYAKVFSEEASHCLPVHKPWDHAIDLKPGASMKNCSIYHLTPKEADALKEYISEHLKWGYIHPSKSPMASPFFFVDKKDRKLYPVQDYHALNDVTVKNQAPLPLIPELIDKLHNACYYTKLDIRWGYNNIRIREGNEYKAAFKTSLGLFKLTVMTFSLCNAPATFQTFMNLIFEPLIDGGHVVVYLNDILIFTEDTTSLSKLTDAILSVLE